MKPSVLIHSLLLVNSALAAEPSVRVRLILEAPLDNPIRGSFVSKAQEILDAAGVRSTWLDCPAKPSPGASAGCESALASNELVIRVLDRGMIGNGHGLGSSVAGAEGGVYGLIYYPSIERMAKTIDMPVSIILALATVHEIGHLLLGSQAHWPAGIMRPQWDRGVLGEMIQRNQFFNKSQSSTLRRRAQLRSPRQ